jgi:tRNA dimethylallyltransferase
VPANQKDKLLVLLGPTAVGKTELSLSIAEQFSCEIIGVDSLQVYKYMDIGTAKPTEQERAQVPHHLIDIIYPDDNYTAGRFVADAQNAIQTIKKDQHVPLLTGGTGLYFRGLLEGLFDENSNDQQKNKQSSTDKTESIREQLKNRLAEEGREQLFAELNDVDPDSAKRIHPNDTQRLIRALEIFKTTGMTWSQLLARQQENTGQYNVLKLGLTRSREELYKRIDQRVQVMIEQGLLEEVRKLINMGYHGDLKSMQSIGYRHMVNYIKGEWDWQESIELLARDTRRYAKRQYTWFNQDPEIIWYEVSQQDAILADIEKFLR